MSMDDLFSSVISDLKVLAIRGAFPVVFSGKGGAIDFFIEVHKGVGSPYIDNIDEVRKKLNDVVEDGLYLLNQDLYVEFLNKIK